MLEAAMIAAGGKLLGTHLQNKAAKAASARQMAFQANMSNTAYQRSMTDMRKAGLNPILAGKLGGASTPGGSTYQPQSVGQAVDTYANVQNVMANTAKTQAETNLIKDTSQSIIGRNFDFFKNLIDKLPRPSIPDSTISSIKDALDRASKQHTLYKQNKKRRTNPPKGNKYPIPKVKKGKPFKFKPYLTRDFRVIGNVE